MTSGTSGSRPTRAAGVVSTAGLGLAAAQVAHPGWRPAAAFVLTLIGCGLIRLALSQGTTRTPHRARLASVIGLGLASLVGAACATFWPLEASRSSGTASGPSVADHAALPLAQVASPAPAAAAHAGPPAIEESAIADTAVVVGHSVELFDGALLLALAAADATGVALRLTSADSSCTAKPSVGQRVEVLHGDAGSVWAVTPLGVYDSRTALIRVERRQGSALSNPCVP